MMAMNAKSKAWLTNSIFSSFVLSVFGWAVLQSFSLRHGAPISVQILVATVGLALSYVSIRRYQAHWPADAGHNNQNVLGCQRLRPPDLI
jgi:protein-S-isoprenylcysteine O-methyltransferase Ste14